MKNEKKVGDRQAKALAANDRHMLSLAVLDDPESRAAILARCDHMDAGRLAAFLTVFGATGCQRRVTRRLRMELCLTA